MSPKSKTSRTIRRILKGFGFLILGLALVLVVLGLLAHESRPEGKPSTDADVLARKMMASIHSDAWDTTGIVQWSLAGMHMHTWDKRRHYDRWQSGKHDVFINLSNQQGRVFKEGQEVMGKKRDAWLQKAWESWTNDAFWLNPIGKAFDEGVTRSLVTLADGTPGLMVAYSSGGVTPGDAYVWILDESFRPKAWKMWVKIIPVGGLAFSWENYETLYSGAQLSTLHDGPFTLHIQNLKATHTIEEMFGEDVFSVLEK